MCGIAGIVSNRISLESTIKDMVARLDHRGPDNSSYSINSNVALGHSRLSIIDLSASANQPMRSSSGNHSIIFNGEIYNYKELKKELNARGCQFNNQSDTEVILNGYICDGIDFFKKIRGFFSLSIFDKKEQTLILARDSHGKKPLFYIKHNGSFYFASELKAIIPQLQSVPSVNYESLSHYLWKGYFANTDSIYTGVKSLDRGGVVTLDLKSIEIKKSEIYKSIHIDVSGRAPRRNIEVVESEIKTAIDYRLIADVPVSFLLSGGVDSSLISYLAGKDKTIDTYYLGYKDKEDPFEHLSTIVSNKVTSNHHIYKMDTPQFSNSLGKMIDLFDEPFADYSALPSYEIYKKISDKTKVAISGDGADEIFCGYKDAKLFLIKSWLQNNLIGKKDITSTDNIYRLLNSRFRSSRMIGNLAALIYIDEGLFSTTTFRGGWNNVFRREFMTNDGYNKTGKDHVEKSEISSFLNAGKNTVERYLNYELKKLTYDFLVKVDRTSMANSLEVRSPYLDTAMIEELNGTSYSCLVSIMQTKKELKTILDSYGLGKISNQTKMGFTPPLGIWMLSESGIAELHSMINSDFINSLFEKSKLSELISTKRSIMVNQGRLWNLMVLNTWHSKHIN